MGRRKLHIQPGGLIVLALAIILIVFRLVTFEAQAKVANEGARLIHPFKYTASAQN